MFQSKWRLYVGAGLVFLGLMALLQSFNLFHFTGYWDLVWAGAFLLGGGIFINVVMTDRKQWWAVIPGCVLAGIGFEIAVSVFPVSVSNALGGFFVLAGIGVAFLLVYWMNRSFWWALIPSGVMFSVMLVNLMEKLAPRLDTGWIFLLGLAVTFFILSRLNFENGVKLSWAIWPAAGLAFVSAITLFAAFDIMGYIWSLALIGVGVFFVYRAIKGDKREF